MSALETLRVRDLRSSNDTKQIRSIVGLTVAGGKLAGNAAGKFERAEAFKFMPAEAN
jgi:hypothetical protein